MAEGPLGGDDETGQCPLTAEYNSRPFQARTDRSGRYRSFQPSAAGVQLLQKSCEHALIFDGALSRSRKGLRLGKNRPVVNTLPGEDDGTSCFDRIVIVLPLRAWRASHHHKGAGQEDSRIPAVSERNIASASALLIAVR
jgi:hypothetical protein